MTRPEKIEAMAKQNMAIFAQQRKIHRVRLDMVAFNQPVHHIISYRQDLIRTAQAAKAIIERAFYDSNPQ